MRETIPIDEVPLGTSRHNGDVTSREPGAATVEGRIPNRATSLQPSTNAARDVYASPSG